MVKRNKGERRTHFSAVFDDIKTHEETAIVTSNQRKITCNTEISMVDGKMSSILKGDSGAYCNYCTATKADGNDCFCIEEGFLINKSIEECWEIWEALQKGDMSYDDPGKVLKFYICSFKLHTKCPT